MRLRASVLASKASIVMFLIIVFYGTTAALGCPFDKSGCDASQECHWGMNGRCISSLPCALETSASSCNINTRGCQWRAAQSQCVRANRRNYANIACGSATDKQSCSNKLRCSWSAASNSCRRRPTIILSVADDLGWYDVGFNNPQARTPVLDTLRKNGVALDRHYGAKFCSPTRSMLLTGRYDWKTGQNTDYNMNPAQSLRCAASPSVDLLPRILKQQGGYRSHMFGKWHMGYYRDDLTPVGRGFETYLGSNMGGFAFKQDAPPADKLLDKRCACAGSGRGQCNLYSNTAPKACAIASTFVNQSSANSMQPVSSLEFEHEGMVDLHLAQQASRLIRATPDDDPLFLYLAWSAPHDPVYSSQRFKDSIAASKPPFTPTKAKNGCSTDMRLTHLGMVMALDEAQGMIIDTLDETDRLQDSIIVFFSDNGGFTPQLAIPGIKCEAFSFNYPLRGSKFSNWEGGIRTVAFVYAPTGLRGQQKGSSYDGLVAVVDWRKTIFSASGITGFQDPNDDGINLWPAISTGDISQGREDIPIQVWNEAKRFVIVFKYQGSLWKILSGYPSYGFGSGYVSRPFKKYSWSATPKPIELPDRNITSPISSGIGGLYECKSNCLFNLSADPGEMKEISKGRKDALNFGLAKLREYRTLNVPYLRTDVCAPTFFQTRDLTVTDGQAIKQAAKCGAFVSWISADGKFKTTC